MPKMNKECSLMHVLNDNSLHSHGIYFLNDIACHGMSLLLEQG